MAALSTIITTLSDKVIQPGKQAIAKCKAPLQRLVKSQSVDRQVLVNEDETASHGGPETDTDMFAYEKAHANKILLKADKCFCCQCRKRWQLAILANIGFIIVFGIRCNFGAAKNTMIREWIDPWGESHSATFNWSSSQLGIIEGSFFYGYIVTQLPGGFLAEKIAPNKLFGMAIGAASCLNLLMPAACSGGAGLVVIVQILQGLVQGVSYPAMHGVWRHWAPPLERSKLATTAFTGSYAGAVIGLPLSATLVTYFHWSTVFYFYGIAGIIWTIFWYSLTFEKPATHPTISNEEKIYIETQLGKTSTVPPSLSNIPWKEILSSKPVWAIIVANFARSWTFYLLLMNQLTYMHDMFQRKITESGFYAALPHLVMAIVVLIGGQLADYLRSRGILSTTAVRKIFNCGGFGGEALFLLVVGYTKSETVAVLGLVLAVGSSGFAISGFNVNHLDIAPRYAALLMGMSNGVGTLSGMICPVITEKLRQHTGGWETVFLLASLIHFTGVTFYAVFASGELQEWAEPPAELEPTWARDDFAQKASQAGMMTSYGTTEPVTIAALPTGPQLRTQQGYVNGPASEYETPQQQQYGYDPNSVWGDQETSAVNQNYYQGY